MFLICGLGNFGKQYDSTRHNVGFSVVDIIAQKHKITLAFKEKYKGELAQVSINNHSAILLKPHTYMNLSGPCVQAVANYYKIPTDKVIVIHDDLDVDLGKIKAKVGGGSAGHNGLKSLDQSIGNGYIRVRVGIGRPANARDGDISDYVLARFKADEREVIEILYYKIVDSISVLLNNDLEGFIKQVK